jgi:hypothetical protein
MSDGARCHYCQKVPCVCADRALDHALNAATRRMQDAIDPELILQARKAAAFDWLERQALFNYAGIGIVDVGSQGLTTIALNGASLLEAVDAAMRAESEAKP